MAEGGRQSAGGKEFGVQSKLSGINGQDGLPLVSGVARGLDA